MLRRISGTGRTRVLPVFLLSSDQSRCVRTPDSTVPVERYYLYIQFVAGDLDDYKRDGKYFSARRVAASKGWIMSRACSLNSKTSSGKTNGAQKVLETRLAPERLPLRFHL